MGSEPPRPPLSAFGRRAAQHFMQWHAMQHAAPAAARRLLGTLCLDARRHLAAHSSRATAQTQHPPHGTSVKDPACHPPTCTFLSSSW